MDTVIHHPSNLPHVCTCYPIHTCLLSADPPRISRPANTRQVQGRYVTQEQCIDAPANVIIYYLGNNYTTLLIHYTLNLVVVTLLLRKSGRNRQKKHQISPDQMIITLQLRVLLQIETHCKN